MFPKHICCVIFCPKQPDRTQNLRADACWNVVPHRITCYMFCVPVEPPATWPKSKRCECYVVHCVVAEQNECTCLCVRLTQAIPAQRPLGHPCVVFSSMEQAVARSVEIEHALERVQREMRNHRRREARSCQIPPAMSKVITTIFVLTHPSIEPAALYLKQKWAQWNSDHVNLRNHLEDWYRQLLDTSGVNSVLNPTTTSGQTVLRRAQLFVAEVGLHSWVETANTQQGIAPLSSVMLDRAASQSTSSGAQSLVRPNMKRKCQLQWLRRWRRRWRVGLGPILARDTLPPAECIKKVA